MESLRMSKPPEQPDLSLMALPSALIATIMTKMDVASLRSAASTCRALNYCAFHVRSFTPKFHLLDVGLSNDLLRPLLIPANPYLASLQLDCTRLDDLSLSFLASPALQEICLHNCEKFTGRILSSIGRTCRDLRSLYLSCLAEKNGRSIDVSDLEQLLLGCPLLETLVLLFDVSMLSRHSFARAWALASSKLVSLELGFISSLMMTELLSPVPVPNQSSRLRILPGLQKLCLSVDYITDTMICTISDNLASLTHLDLRDSPIMEPRTSFDLTNIGLQHINPHGKLKHLSLVRGQEIFPTFFKRVNDLGMLLMADRCLSMESICLGGFCQVTDTGFKTLLHSCANLHQLKVSYGFHLTDLIFHDITATSLALTHVSLRWCHLLTNFAIIRLAANSRLTVLDLRDCRQLGDNALKGVSVLSKLRTLLLDGTNISDGGLYHLGKGKASSLVELSLRGCKRLTDKCISFLFDCQSNRGLRELDLSNLPHLSDAGMLRLAKSQVPISKLRLRQCPLIGDTSVIALASMKIDENGWNGSSLRLLDLHNCGGITQLAFRWLKKPYFPRLRWLGVTGSVNRDVMDSLTRNRPFLHIGCRGEELGVNHWLDNPVVGHVYMHDHEEIDELEQWLINGEDVGDHNDGGDGDGDNDSDEEMEEAEHLE